MPPDVEEQERPSRPPDPGRWREILEFERGWRGPPSSKARAVRADLGISPTRYQQLLNRLLDLPEALEYDPMLVHRLRRLRETRRRKRYTRRLGLEA